MGDKVYCYPDSNVLINKLNIRDRERLHEAERKLTLLRIHDLLEQPLRGQFDLKHLQAIHKSIFQDLYPWAGEIRTVDIAKSNLFCKVQFLHLQAQEIFDKLKKDQYLDGMPRNLFVQKLSYYFSEINALHPFREGNGRAQREFIRQLALRQGYVLHFAVISEEEMLEASVESFMLEYGKMEALFTRALGWKSM